MDLVFDALVALFFEFLSEFFEFLSKLFNLFSQMLYFFFLFVGHVVLLKVWAAVTTPKASRSPSQKWCKSTVNPASRSATKSFASRIMCVKLY